MTRKSLLKAIDESSFAADDARLYLDTHKHDLTAQAYYLEQIGRRNASIAEYTRQYGPIKSDAMCASDAWQWTDDPWPWDYEE